MALKCILASMDGMTTAAFRSICFEYGADGAATEMIPAIGYARAKKKSKPIMDALVLRRPEEQGELAAQIIGNKPALMVQAAQKLEALNRFDRIEINMGCPARTVVSSGNGSAILNNLPLAEEILRGVCGAVSLPVRLKLRLGWDDEHIAAPEVCRIAEDAGCESIILHGRTRQQLYSGEVNLEEMRRVVQAVSLPVYANGAVVQPKDAARFQKETGAAGVCIGRAALKSPWIFEDIRLLERGEAIPERNAGERVGMLLRFAERLCEQKAEFFAVQELRKFCLWYLAGLTGADEAFERVKYVDSLDGFRAVHEDFLNGLIRRNDLHVHPELLPGETLDTVKR